jgi:hypothetical protein
VYVSVHVQVEEQQLRASEGELQAVALEVARERAGGKQLFRLVG